MAKSDLVRVAQRGTHVSALLAHPGWRVVEEYLQRERTLALEVVLDHDDATARATVKVVDGVVRHVKNLAEAGKKAEFRLQTKGAK